MNKRQLRIALLILVCNVFALSVYSQPGGGGDPDPPSPVPITGVELLMLAGAAFGVKKLVSKKEDK